VRNLELKAAYADFDHARAVVRGMGGRFEHVERQEDVYFHVRSGRLKVRRRVIARPDGETRTAELVGYVRADQSGFRGSEYTVVPVQDADVLEAALRATLGVFKVVRKRREVHLYRNARVHLDEVEGLGKYLEIEIVLSSPEEETAAGGFSAELTRRFEIDPGEMISGSYSDLLDSSSPN